MFIALQKAAQRCRRRLHFVMAGWFPGGETDYSCYQEAARRYAPDVSVHFLDGGKEPRGGALLLGCCGSVPFAGRQSSGNFWPGSGSDGGWFAGGGE